MIGKPLGTSAVASNPFYQTAEWKLGDAAQTEWAKMITRKGFVVLPTYGMDEVDAATKAPVLFSCGGLLIAPDLLLMRPDIGAIWQDVKGKSKPTWRKCKPKGAPSTAKFPRWEHGCDYSIATEYRQVQEKTGAPMFIIVKELESPSNDSAESPLVRNVVWLSISLNDAFAKGDHRDDWPGGKSQPHRRGRRGKGGLLWARSDMKRINTAGMCTAIPGVTN